MRSQRDQEVIIRLFALAMPKFHLRKSAFAAAGRVSVIGSNYTDSMWSLASAPIPEEQVTHGEILSNLFKD